MHALHTPGESGVDCTTYAYVEGGSGGGFTLRSCVARAMPAVNRFAFAEDAD